LIVVVVFRPYNMGITSISDDKSQAYTALWSNVLVGGQNRTWFYYVLNSVADVSSVTITLPDTDERGGCFVGRYTGVATSDAIDQGDYADSSAGGSPWSSDSVTTTTAKDLLIGIMGATLTSWGGTNGIPSASGSWTQDQWMGGASVQYIDGGNGAMFAYAHQIISSTGDYSNAGTTASDTTTFDHYGFIVAFKGLCQ
jgi:hypothetical protein